jgi:hypothetical protein
VHAPATLPPPLPTICPLRRPAPWGHQYYHPSLDVGATMLSGSAICSVGLWQWVHHSSFPLNCSGTSLGGPCAFHRLQHVCGLVPLHCRQRYPSSQPAFAHGRPKPDRPLARRNVGCHRAAITSADASPTPSAAVATLGVQPFVDAIGMWRSETALREDRRNEQRELETLQKGMVSIRCSSPPPSLFGQ